MTHSLMSASKRPDPFDALLDVISFRSSRSNAARMRSIRILAGLGKENQFDHAGPVRASHLGGRLSAGNHSPSPQSQPLEDFRRFQTFE